MHEQKIYGEFIILPNHQSPPKGKHEWKRGNYCTPEFMGDCTGKPTSPLGVVLLQEPEKRSGATENGKNHKDNYFLIVAVTENSLHGLYLEKKL